MHTTFPSFILGYHGCDEEVAEKVFAGKEGLRNSENAYDWLGSGIYFWEQNAERARLYAEEMQQRARIKVPAIVGAVIDLKNCLNLLDSSHLQLVATAYEVVLEATHIRGTPLPTNAPATGKGEDLLLRDLDCLVIQTLHTLQAERGDPEFDSVRGVFFEGAELYPNAGFRQKNHIQVCIRNPDCIKGYFRVQTEI